MRIYFSISPARSKLRANPTIPIDAAHIPVTGTKSIKK
jgi:hypothetical protein